MNFIKVIASRLPLRWQQGLRRLHFRRKILKGTFHSNEPEYVQLGDWVTAGDWVIDIGANVGHYTLKLSSLVGEHGRVIAIEPITEAFEILSANVALLRLKNVTLLNVAGSSKAAIVNMTIPKTENGLQNFYMAHVADQISEHRVLTVPLDTLDLPHRISLVKLDAENHELPILHGMQKLLTRDYPLLIIEGNENSSEIDRFMTGLGYTFSKITGSPNHVYKKLN